MLDQIDAITEMIEGATFAAHRRDVKLRPTERWVEIISEASRHLPPELTEQHGDQPWPEIAAIGNLLRHEYQRVDDLIMWKIASRSLSEFQPAIVDMLKRTGE